LLYSGNSIYFPCVIIGTIMAGGIFTGANPTYVARELAYQLTNSGARFLIASTGSIDTALEAAKLANVGLDRVFAFDDGLDTATGQGQAIGEVRHWTHLVASEEEGKAYRWPELSPEQVKSTTATLNYSSGTTGVPKGVEVTHTNYVSNAVQVECQGRLDPEYDEKNKRAKLLCFLPMYHAYGLTVYTVNAAKQNIPIYMVSFSYNFSFTIIQI
jgi:4-coumarate--CoA ligase